LRQLFFSHAFWLRHAAHANMQWSRRRSFYV
jgi:hypothetical protein